MKKTAAIFIDRDGTLNPGTKRVVEMNAFSLIDGAAQAIKKLNQANYLVIIITNQSAIARGMMTHATFEQINQKMKTLLQKGGAHVDGVYYCAHHPQFNQACNCRKPATGMLEQAQQDFNIDMQASWLIGDNTSDIQTAINAKLKSILVQTGYAGRDGQFIVSPTYQCKDIVAAVDTILR